jgi:hypothetical protein
LAAAKKFATGSELVMICGILGSRFWRRDRSSCRRQYDGLVGADEFGAGPADGFLFRQLMRVARGEGKFIGRRVDQARPAVHPAQTSGRFQGGDIPAHGGNGSSDLARQLFQRRKFHPIEVILDRFWRASGCI